MFVFVFSLTDDEDDDDSTTALEEPIGCSKTTRGEEEYTVLIYEPHRRMIRIATVALASMTLCTSMVGESFAQKKAGTPTAQHSEQKATPLDVNNLGKVEAYFTALLQKINKGQFGKINDKQTAEKIQQTIRTAWSLGNSRISLEFLVRNGKATIEPKEITRFQQQVKTIKLNPSALNDLYSKLQAWIQDQPKVIFIQASSRTSAPKKNQRK
jgi:hypothetical protein